MTVILTRRATLQSVLETTYGVPQPVDAYGVLCNNPMFSVATNALERDFMRNDLSPLPIIQGRKLARMEFETELRGNGSENTGLPANDPLITRLFRACGYALTRYPAPNMMGPYDSGYETNEVSWASSVAGATNTDVVCYLLAVTTGGASGAAKVQVTSDTVGESGGAPVTITSGTPIPLGTKGATITPTFAGNLQVGQQWTVWLRPPGMSLDPISTGQVSLTNYLHYDGTLHTMPGAYGTFEITAQAGQLATIRWTFTGTYVAPVDDPMPSPTYETELPHMVELARLWINGFAAIVDRFTFNQANDVQIRPSVSASDGYIGTRITNRRPEGGIDPEADNVANQPFWNNLATGLQMPFQMRIGTAAGNTVWFFAPNCQYSGLTYKDRNGNRAYDAGLRFARSKGDDECSIYFC